jgi:NACHT domain- and WD repeat-containing protein
MAAVAIQRGIQIWLLNTPELSKTFENHTAIITCIHFAPNGEFICTGSEDKSVMVWGLQFGILQTNFKAHNAAISCLTVMMDSRRVVTSDREGYSHVWLADSGTILQTIQGPHKCLAVTNNMKFAVSFVLCLLHARGKLSVKESFCPNFSLLCFPFCVCLDEHKRR